MNSQSQYIDPTALGTELDCLIGKKIGILGANGQVGRRLLSILSFNSFPHENLTLLGREARKISYGTKTLQVESLKEADLSDFDLVFSCVPSEVIKEVISSIWNDRCVVIDKSSAFRMQKDVPLVIPEINGKLVAGKKLISSPNCVAIPLAMTLDAILPLLSDITQVAVSTYQSVSGAGDKAMRALVDETQETFLYNPKVMPRFFEKQIAFNILPKIGEFDENYSTEEENKIAAETNFVLGKKLPISVMAVRVPVVIGHSIAIHIACKFKDIPSIEAALESYDGIEYITEGRYISPPEVVNEDGVYISRLKRTDSGLCLWVVTDNLHKGAALNAIQISVIANTIN